ncbi:hypothetical protein TSAR_012351 [Trichomalopsis sarcophagae]|uniref:Uncharacterized protein n=1 Tax=Trichomalopsis sarcophagae TaxID=543379 RepID=A0A232ENF1_9HYME|nr:hypothetical protein TSAR_012351 [Trichomalopsis sarcophagae]
MKYLLFVFVVIALITESVYGCSGWQQFKCSGKCFFSKRWECIERPEDDYECICTPLSG